MTAGVIRQIELVLKPRRLDSQRERVLRMLRSNEWVTNHDFCAAFIPNFRSRLSELRQEGFRISEGEAVKKGLYRYRLEGGPTCR